MIAATKPGAVHVQKYHGAGARRFARYIDMRAARETRRDLARKQRALERAREELAAKRSA